MRILPIRSPASPYDLLYPVTVIVRSKTVSIEENALNLFGLNTISLHISSDRTMRSWYFATISAKADNSDFVKTLPVGLSGLQRQMSLVLGVISASSPEKSINPLVCGVGKVIAFAPTCSTEYLNKKSTGSKTITSSLG